MSNLIVPDWDTYDRQDAFPYRLDDINSFSLSVDFPAIADWDNAQLRSKLHDRLHDDVTKLLRTAEFYRESSLEQSKGPDYFAVDFKDDVYDFQIACYNNRLLVRKSGILLRTFHHWYYAAVPSFKQVFESVLSVMSKELSRNQAITSVLYNFAFVTHDFSDRGRRLKNYQVLSKLITQVPSKSGEIGSMSEDPRDISRLDYKVNYWDGDEKDKRRRITYSVEGPSNHGFTGLWFNFSYGSETYTDPDSGVREWVEPAVLLEESDRVYDFFWQRAMGGFMKSLLSHLSFKTTATYIP